MSQPLLLILGYGPNNGLAIAQRFAAAGYRIAVASRSLEDGKVNEEGWLQLRVDLSHPEALPGLFAAVKEKMGIPSVVVYNASIRRLSPARDALSLAHHPSLPELIGDFNINGISAFVAAQYAVEGFKQLPESASRTYIFTGNALNEMMNPLVPAFGMMKKGVSFMIEAADISYRDAGYRFYFTDERCEDGMPVLQAWDGPARAEMCLKLATEKSGPYLQTYVKGKGYVDFRRTDPEIRLNWVEKMMDKEQDSKYI